MDDGSVASSPDVVSGLDFDLSQPEARRRFLRCSGDTRLEPTSSGLRVEAHGPDPFVVTPILHADLRRHTLLQLNSDLSQNAGQVLKIYFSTDASGDFHETRALPQSIPRSHGPTDLYFDFSDNPFWVGSQVELRIDLEDFDGEKPVAFELRRLTLRSWSATWCDLWMPSCARPGESFHVVSEIRAHGYALAQPTLSEGLEVVESAHPQRLRGASSLAAWKVLADRPGLHQMTFPSADGDTEIASEIWVPDTRRTLRAVPFPVRHGLVEITATRQDGAKAAFVPTVEATFCDGSRVRRMVLVLDEISNESGPGCPDLCLEGHRNLDEGHFGARLELRQVADGQVHWGLKLELPPRAQLADLRLPTLLLGDPRQDEESDLIHVPGHLMRAGHQSFEPGLDLSKPGALTWPCAFFEQGSVHYATSWHSESQDASVAIAPSLRHLGFSYSLSLYWPPRDAGRAFAPAVSACDLPSYVSAELRILPRAERRLAFLDLARPWLEKPEPTDAREDETNDDATLLLSLIALTGTFGDAEGLTILQRGPVLNSSYFDTRVFTSRLLAKRLGLCGLPPELEASFRRFADRNHPLPLEIGLLLPEYLQRSLDSLAAHVESLVATQRADGGWTTETHGGSFSWSPGALASTTTAIAAPVYKLLQGYLLGFCSPEPVEAALAALRCAGPLPTGGQPWEFLPQVPDLLAIGHLAEAWILAMETGLADDCLTLALDWLTLGMTFLALGPDDDPQERSLACIPALGTTRASDERVLWFTHDPDDQRDWRGVSCPWVGLRFCEAIQLGLEAQTRHGSWPGDTAALLDRVCRRVVRHAAGLQHSDGGIPDGYEVRLDRLTEPALRAPIELACLLLAQRGTPTRLRMARHRNHVATGIGRFEVEEGRLVFHPGAPGDQVALVQPAPETAIEPQDLLQSARRLDGSVPFDCLSHTHVAEAKST